MEELDWGYAAAQGGAGPRNKTRTERALAIKAEKLLAIEGDDLCLPQNSAAACNDGPDEFDPLDDSVPEHFRCFDSAPEDDDDDSGREFASIKPWLGTIKPPSKYVANPLPPENSLAPEPTLELDYVWGYRARNCRNNAFWVDHDTILFHAAAVGILYHIDSREADFYRGHTDDIVCMDYHPERKYAATGQVGAGFSVRLCIWQVERCGVDPVEITVISGFFQYAVVSVKFSPDGKLVAGVGMDEHHSIGVYEVDTGILKYSCAGDKNRIINVIWNITQEAQKLEVALVTSGVQHMCFWAPPNTENNDLSDALSWQHGHQLDIQNLTLTSIACTTQFTLAGSTTGEIFVFSFAKCVFTIDYVKAKLDIGVSKVNPTTLNVCSLQTTHLNPDIVLVGCNKGYVIEMTMSSNPSKPDVQGVRTLDMNKFDELTDNDSDVYINGVRSIHVQPGTDTLLVGTILSTLYKVTNPFKAPKSTPASTLVRGHFGNLKDPNGYGELWGLDVHPSKDLVYTCGDDGTVRLWDTNENKQVASHLLGKGALSVSVNHSASMVAVGLRNGSFVVYNGDLSKIVNPLTRNRNRRVTSISFSPDGTYLAVAAHVFIDIYNATKGFAFVGTCTGHTSNIIGIDWNLSGHVLQSASRSYELLYFAVPNCRQITSAKMLADERWFTQSCVLGWSVQGIWPRFADGTDVNSVARSNSEQLLVTTDDWGQVKLFNFPCVGSGLDRFGHLKDRPLSSVFTGHSSHVTTAQWSHDDTYVYTTGGGDICLFRWKVKYPEGYKKGELLNHELIHRKIAASDPEMLSPEKRRPTLNFTPPPTESSPQRQDSPPPSSEWPSVCPMCEYAYSVEQNTLDTCPVCRAGRNGKPKRMSFKQWRAQMESRHLEPTAAFASSAKEQLKLRKAIEQVNSSAPTTWRSAAFQGRRIMKLPVPESDSDEEEIVRKKLSAKKTAGPAFSNF